jgi:integrase
MSKTLAEAQLTTPTARQKLATGLHWRSLDADVHLGYRKGARGGRWIVRRRAGPGYRQEVIGTADDFIEADGLHTLTFYQASSKARQIVQQRRANVVSATRTKPLTVRHVIDEYIVEREKRELGYNRDARYRLSRYVLETDLADRELGTITELDLQSWRNALPERLARSTVRRHVSDLKAGLNRAARLHRAQLPAEFYTIVRAGLAAPDYASPVARTAQILSDDLVRRIVEAAREVDEKGAWEGDLFRMILMLAATGARFSQIIRLTVSSFENGRLLIPTSRKGHGTKKSRTVPVRVGQDVLQALVPVLTNRSPGDMLLERYRRTQISPTKWVKYRRGPWLSASELVRPWRLIREISQLSVEVVPYALRHSSIVRGLKAGLPVRTLQVCMTHPQR